MVSFGAAGLRCGLLRRRSHLCGRLGGAGGAAALAGAAAFAGTAAFAGAGVSASAGTGASAGAAALAAVGCDDSPGVGVTVHTPCGIEKIRPSRRAAANQITTRLLAAGVGQRYARPMAPCISSLPHAGDGFCATLDAPGRCQGWARLARGAPAKTPAATRMPPATIGGRIDRRTSRRIRIRAQRRRPRTPAKRPRSTR